MITYDELILELQAGASAGLMMRHAERPHIDREDPTFGESLSLTAEGEALAQELGKKFQAFAEETEFHSSPMNRTRTTARRFAEGMGVDEPDIAESDELGNGSFYFTDQLALFEAFKGRDIYPMMEDYLHGKPLAGMGDIKAASNRLEKWINEHHNKRFSLFVTHDLYTAAFLTARNAAEFTASRWLGFLDSAAIIKYPNGSRRYEYVVYGCRLFDVA